MTNKNILQVEIFHQRYTEEHGDKDKDWAQSGRMFIEEKRENNWKHEF